MKPLRSQSAAALALVGLAGTSPAQANPDRAPHQQRFITVEPGVSIEVLDWGGTGRPAIIIPGQVVTAHSFDAFAPKLATDYHVYVITPRGFGASSRPDSGYDADRLGDDLLAVMDSLHVSSPILIGHSFGGEEVSSVASRYPRRIAGAVYLDAAFEYAFYDSTRGSIGIDLPVMKRKIDSLVTMGGQLVTARTSYAAARKLIDDLLGHDLAQFERSLRDFRSMLPDSDAVADNAAPARPSPDARVLAAEAAGVHKYTRIGVPALAIYALPTRKPRALQENPVILKMLNRRDSVAALQADAFERGVPGSRVVRIPNADHLINESNEADVLREIHAFIASLPR